MSNCLSAYTTMGVGGPARSISIVTSSSELKECASRGIVLGGGSNVLVSDDGVDLDVYINRCRGISVICDTVTVSSGERLPILCGYLAEKGLSGMEWACGIPGSVGGAIVMNAGAFGFSLSDVIVCAEIVRDGRLISLDKTALGFGYRSSAILPTDTVISATFKLSFSDASRVKAGNARYAAARRNSQPTGRSAGSIFKNPPGISVGRVLDEARLKGTRRGGAIISLEHANIIVNTGGATAKNVTELISVMKSVLLERGITAEEEIKYIGGFN